MPNGIRPADKTAPQPKVDERIAGAFARASEATGTSFDYLVTTSQRESDHRPELGSSTSSAKGLFQFVDQTWLGLVKREGPSVGLEKVAEKIVSDGKGGWTVKDLNDKTRILALKTDPLVASMMAGRFTRDNARQLREGLGRDATDGELYAAHVLGAAGALKLMRVAKSEPNATAATIFPRAAAANSELFYGAKGTPRTARELLANLAAPRSPSEDPTSARIAAAHQALSGANAKVDPATIAAMVRAQASALVSKEATAAGNPLTAAATAADRRYADTALSATTLPGEARGASPPMAGGLGGWRAGSTRDAFTGLMRSDAAAAADGAARLSAAPGSPVPQTDASAGASRAARMAVPSPVRSAPVPARAASPDGPPPIISAPGEVVAATPPSPQPAVGRSGANAAPLLPPVPTLTTGLPPTATPPTATPPAVAAAGRPTPSTGGGPGGIPVVDPFQPMNIGTTATVAGSTPGATIAQPVVTTASAQAGPVSRPSRIFAYAAAGGAPAVPFPIVDAASGATRPSRLLFEQHVAPDVGTAGAPGAVRVRTTTINLPTPEAQPASDAAR